MIKKLTLKFVKHVRYSKRKGKMEKLYRDRKGNLYIGFSKLTSKIHKLNDNI